MGLEVNEHVVCETKYERKAHVLFRKRSSWRRGFRLPNRDLCNPVMCHTSSCALNENLCMFILAISILNATSVNAQLIIVRTERRNAIHISPSAFNMDAFSSDSLLNYFFGSNSNELWRHNSSCLLEQNKSDHSVRRYLSSRLYHSKIANDKPLHLTEVHSCVSRFFFRFGAFSSHTRACLFVTAEKHE